MDTEAKTDLEALMRVFPKEAIKTRTGGGSKALSYYSTDTIIRRLNEATNNCWDLVIISEREENGLLTAHVRLTLPGRGSREHVGVQRVNDKGGDDLRKGAVSDAIKKAATLFGVGLELYGEDYEADDRAAREAEEERKRRAEAFRAVLTSLAELGEKHDFVHMRKADNSPNMDGIGLLVRNIFRVLDLPLGEKITLENYTTAATRFNEFLAAFKDNPTDIVNEGEGDSNTKGWGTPAQNGGN